MRAVCTRGRFEGGWEQPTLARVCVCTHTRRVEDPSSFSLRATAERIHPRAKKLYYFGGKILFFDPPPILLLSRLLFFLSFPSSFFQTDHPLFRTARASPPERGGNRGRERGEKPVLLCTAEILSQTRYYFSRYYPVRAFCSFCCCNCARCKVD